MKIVRTKIMNLIGKKYMLVFCWLLTAPKAKITEVDLNHEKIHSEQFIEMTIASLAFLGVLSLFLNSWLFLLSPFMFYILYVLEWLVRLIQYKGTYMAYKNISFEREAYQSEEDLYYLKCRKIFNFINYIR